MTYKEALAKEKKWHRRAILINLYHQRMLLKSSKWTLRMTAKRLSISLGCVSENIRLANALINSLNLESLSRKEALKIVRSEK